MKALIDYCIDIPVAFAIWEDQTDTVLLSSKMQALIRCSSALIASFDFVKSIKHLFGNFLYEAVEKTSYTQFTNSRYNATITTNYNKTYNLTLIFNIKSRVYTLTVFDTNTSYIPSSQAGELKLLTDILDNLPIYIWRKNKENKLLYCNNKYAQALNSNKTTIIKNNDQLYSTPSTTSLLKKTSHIDNFKINGQNKEVIITEYPLNNQIVGFAIDNVKIENKTLLQNDLIKFILNNLSVGVALFNKSMDLILSNQIIISMFSLENLDLSKITYIEIIDFILSNEILICADSKKTRDDLLSIFTNTTIQEDTKIIQLNNGKTMDVKISTHQDMILIVVNDISSTLKFERKINSVRNIYQNILKNLEDGIIIFGSDNRIKFINPTIIEIFKPKQEDFYDIHISDFFKQVSDDFISSEEYTNFINKILNNSEQRINHSEVIKLANNRSYVYTYLPIPDGLHIVKFKDLSEYKFLESELHTAENKVNQIANLKNNLILKIADEYIAPVNTIQSFTEILLNQYFGQLNDKQLKYCSGIIKTSKYLKNIADAITTIAAIQTEQVKIQFTEVNIFKLVKEVTDQFKDIENKTVQFLIECTNTNIVAYIDKNLMQKAIYYVILKALYMIEKHGIIQIIIKETDHGFFELSVIDDGAGFSPEDLEQYRKYFVNKANVEESNTLDIGYILASKITNLHNGTLQIQSKLNESTIITFNLPIHQFLS